MSLFEFSGKSPSGNIEEALQLAFQAAKEGLRSSMVKWKIADISGISGGFVEVNEVAVRILAEPPN